jgi:hypothetical protein
MINSFNCDCGNRNPDECVEYDGCLGYEAIVCTRCGRYFDTEGEHQPDNFSTSFLATLGIDVRVPA